MQDGIIKGTGNSRYLKSISDFLTQYPTYQDFAKALEAGKLPVDFNGINPTGWDQLGTDLNKSTLLSDETAALCGLGVEAVPDDALKIVATRAPVGTVLWYASQTVPGGYLLCDGSAVSRTDYAALFKVIGTKFGVGDGSTTFALPDLRASFIRGAGTNNGYSATFAQKQEATTVGYRGNQYGSMIGRPQNPDKTSSVQELFAQTNVGSNNAYTHSYMRPYNLALTPVIKY